MAQVTSENSSISGFPNSYASQRYMDALEEAAEFMRTHEKEEELPGEIIVKAIGPYPPYCDSPDSDTMLEAMNSFNQYRRDVGLFIQRASVLSLQ